MPRDQHHRHHEQQHTKPETTQPQSPGPGRAHIWGKGGPRQGKRCSSSGCGRRPSLERCLNFQKSQNSDFLADVSYYSSSGPVQLYNKRDGNDAPGARYTFINGSERVSIMGVCRQRALHPFNLIYKPHRPKGNLEPDANRPLLVPTAAGSTPLYIQHGTTRIARKPFGPRRTLTKDGTKRKPKPRGIPHARNFFNFEASSETPPTGHRWIGHKEGSSSITS